MAELLQVPGGGRLFRHEDGWWGIEYDVPASPNAAKMYYHIPDSNSFAAIVGSPPDQAQPDFEISSADFHVKSAGGMFLFGTTHELVNREEHPFAGFLGEWERRSQVEPWLLDPEVLGLTAQAILEDWSREQTQAAMQSTNWWRTRTDGERNWFKLSASDPLTAERRLEDNRRATAEAVRAAGVDNLPGNVADLIADKVTRGEWSESFAAEQVRKLSDPFAPGDLDPTITEAVRGLALDTTRDRVERVRGMAREYLGPLYGDWSEDQLNRWAGRVRNDPDGETALLDHLRGTLKSVFGERVTDPALTYEDIAQPTRVHFANVWGTTPDERDAFFVNIARQTDHTQAEAMLRQEGLKRDVQKVKTDATEGLLGVFGQPLGRV